MENCTIYSHKLEFEKVGQIIKTNLPNAKVEYSDDGRMQKSLKVTIKGGFFDKKKSLTMNYRQRKKPSYKLEEIECGLTQNLSGMVNFIKSLPARNEEVRDKFLYKVMSANCEMSFMADPQITEELASVLREILHNLDGIVFAQPSDFFNKSSGQHFLNKDFDLILDVDGNCEVEDIEVNVEAKYHDQPPESYSEEQLDRKVESESFLSDNGITLNKNLPCIPVSTQVNLRATEEVIERAYALLVVAAKGEGVAQEYLIKTVEEKSINSFSPKETVIYRAETLNDQDKAYATWRYESLYVILWALGKMDELKYPNEICDVSTIVSQIFKPSRKEFESSVKLRGVIEILNELDKTYRMNWACVDSRVKGQEVSGNINSSIVYERHYALNWLVNHEGQNWDEIQTNT